MTLAAASTLCILTGAVSVGAVQAATTATTTPAQATAAPATKPPTNAAAAPAAAPMAPAGASAATMVDEVKIVCGEKAKGDGEVNLTFTPEGGAPKDIRTLVAKGMHPKNTCETIATNLKVVLGSGFEVKSDGEKIKIEGKKKAKFSLVLGSQTVPGLTVSIQ
jgi:hypothetical protein